MVFALADLLNVRLLLPNLIVLLILSPQVFSATREYCLKGATHLCSSVHSNLVPSSKATVRSGNPRSGPADCFDAAPESSAPVQPAAQHDTCVPNGLAQVRFLQSYGWEVNEQPCEMVQVVIPETFGDVYENYNEIQKQQGL